MLCLIWVGSGVARAATNPITLENAKAGNPASQWDVSGAGDPSIQGFATQISVNKGEIVRFKIKTTATSYRLEIYRLGYYNNLGARLIATISPSASLPQSQPNPLSDPATGLLDCGNWGESASWQVPATATSGIYIVKLVRADNGGASHMIFVVRDDQGASDILFQTSDTTWQAYNSYGGNSLYSGAPAGRAYKVSYNRPFNTRAGGTSFDWVFNAEYPMLRWLEANGYNVSYTTGVDSDVHGNLLASHRVFLSVGHDEYWSRAQRSNVEAARAAGTHLAFFSGNEIFWKTRWENSIDGSATPCRTLVCYKETTADAKIDPSPTWTGTWRDPRFSPPSDGGRPENGLSGTIFSVNASQPTDRITVPFAYSSHWFWSHTGVDALASGGTASLVNGSLGYEWDESPDNGFQAPGLLHLSSTTISGLVLLLDYGSTYGVGTATHSLSLYRHSSGAFVFGAGTVQWSWGLDSVHDNAVAGVSSAMRQATVNLLAKMQAQPGSLQSGLVVGSASLDSVPPTSNIQSPTPGTAVGFATPVTVRGVASDAGGRVWSVEVSADGGASWHSAVGDVNWSYSWVPSNVGSVTLQSRAVDDSGNLESPGPGVAINVTSTQGSIWPSSALPGVLDGGPDNAVEVGVRFVSDSAGTISGVRFYKALANTGIHVGSLWSSSGTRLATVTFSGESASGWQQMNFSTPVAISANTIYVASYHTNVGHYSDDLNYFTGNAVSNPPLHLLADGVSGANGVYAYGAGSVFPTLGYFGSNYWVDVAFQSRGGASLASIAVTPLNPVINIGATQQFVATGSYSDGSIQDLSSQVTWTSSTPALASITTGGLATGVAVGTTTIGAGLSGVNGSSGLAVQSSLGATSRSIWSATAVPSLVDGGADKSVELGVRFRSDVAGWITGIRFYKASANTGTHVGCLWTTTGSRLASATFAGETASGWQEVSFASPVAISANTVYVASYHARSGHYSADSNYFATAGVDNAPLHALANGASGANSVYAYGTNSLFPTKTWVAANYWVDVVFHP